MPTEAAEDWANEEGLSKSDLLVRIMGAQARLSDKPKTSTLIDLADGETRCQGKIDGERPVAKPKVNLLWSPSYHAAEQASTHLTQISLGYDYNKIQSFSGSCFLSVGDEQRSGRDAN